MTCPARCFDCGCPAGTCQIPHYAILEPAHYTSTARVLILSTIFGIILGAGLTMTCPPVCAAINAMQEITKWPM